MAKIKCIKILLKQLRISRFVLIRRSSAAHRAHVPQRVGAALHARGAGAQGRRHRGLHEDPLHQGRQLHPPVRHHGRVAEGGDEEGEEKDSGDTIIAYFY